MKLNKLHILALSVLFAAAACEREADDDLDGAADTLGDTLAARADTVMDMPMEPSTTDLDEVDDSGISGEAVATHSQQEVTVSILLKEGAQPNVSYPAHIHTGNCKDGGPVAVELSPVQNLQSSKTIQLSQLPADRPAFIQIHDEGGKPVACGNMKGHEGDDVMRRDTARTTTN